MPLPGTWLKLCSMFKTEHILEKGTGAANEDRLLISPNLFGVFDGATSLTSGTTSLESGTGGAMAASIARNTFSNNHYPLPRLADQANTAIRKKMLASGVNINRFDEVWSTSAAVVRIKEDQAEWFRTGDSQILIIYEDGSHEALGRCRDHDYPSLVMMKEMADKTLSNPVLRRQVLLVRKQMNDAYGVLNGDEKARDFFYSGRVSLESVKSVLIFTDGLNLPCDTPGPEKTFSDMVRDYEMLGLSGLHKKIREIEKADPDRKKFPRFKCHDDIAAIALTFRKETA